MIDPGSNPTGLSKNACGSWLVQPRTSPNTHEILQKMFSAQLKTTLSTEGKNAAKSQEVMEIPAITSETLTAPKP